MQRLEIVEAPPRKKAGRVRQVEVPSIPAWVRVGEAAAKDTLPRVGRGISPLPFSQGSVGKQCAHKLAQPRPVALSSCA